MAVLATREPSSPSNGPSTDPEERGLDTSTIPQELIGNAALTIAFVLIAWALLREAAKWVIKLLVLFGVLVGAAVVTGFLDNTAASGLLYWIGAWISEGIVALATWMADTWQQLMGNGEPTAG
jgi:hypothetical protein